MEAVFIVIFVLLAVSFPAHNALPNLKSWLEVTEWSDTQCRDGGGDRLELQCSAEGGQGRRWEDKQGFPARTKHPSLLGHAVLEAEMKHDLGKRRFLICTGSHQTC